MTYKATIHTMEIEPVMKPENVGNEWAWWKNIYRKNLPFITSKRTAKDGSIRIIINTHRMHTTPEGKYIFTYGGLSEHLRDMETVCREMEIDGYIIRRMDVCLDANAPYAQTQKLTRLIALMLGDVMKMENRYISADPVTGDTKTLRLDDGTKKASARHQIEHYNRELVDQTDYSGDPIINRFELRAMGVAAGVNNTEGDIVARWIERLEGLTESDMQRVCELVNDGLEQQCLRYLDEACNNSSTEINAFLRVYGADHIYSRKQLKTLLDMLGIEANEAYTRNLLNRSGERFRRYRWKQVRAEIERMKTALRGFAGA